MDQHLAKSKFQTRGAGLYENALQFHWSPLPFPNLPDDRSFIAACRTAEAAGIQSVHVPVETFLPDALDLARRAAVETENISFRIGWNFEHLLASLFGRDLKSTCDAIGPRLILHMAFPDQDLTQNGRFGAAAEFITNCRALFAVDQAPPFDIEGDSAEAAFLSIKHGDCLWRVPHRPNQVYADALPVVHFGKAVGLVASVVARETREEALDVLRTLIPKQMEDAASWVTPFLWVGTSPNLSHKSAVLAGSFEEVAGALHSFNRNRISHFLVRDMPGHQEIGSFGSRIVPLVRQIEAASAG